jgi:O-antigen/teichoic acid export membrane protein
VGLAFLALIYGGVQSQNKLAQSYFQSKSEFRKSGIVNNFKNVSLLVFILAVFVIFHKTSDTAAAVVTTISSTVAFVACVVLIWKDNKSTSLNISLKLLKSLLSESKWLILYFIFQSLFSSVCLVILNQFGTPYDVASFGVANKYYNLLLMFLTSLQTVLRVKTSQKDMVDSANRRKEFSVNWVKRLLPVILAVVVIAAICSGFVLPLLNGEGYDDAVDVFRILLIAVFFGYLFSPNTAVLIAAKKHKTLLLLAIISCVTGGLMCFLLLPVIGVKAAAISIVVSNLILNGTGYIIILRQKDQIENGES